MFDIPEPYRAPKRQPSDPMASRWAKFTGKNFTCDMCIMNVHDGITDPPLSKAKHSYTRGEKRWLLCHTHATQVRSGERSLPA